jgi:hypothetical protein
MKYVNEAIDALVDQNQKDAVMYALHCYDLGTPVVADADRYVTSTNMKVGAYTVAAQPDVPRNVTVTNATGGGAADTLGTITVTGTNYLDEEISEVITPEAAAAVSGTKAFKTITSIVGEGWVIDTTADTITVGCGNELGLPFILEAAADVPFGVLGGTMLACAATVTDPATLEGSTVDMSAGTYDGSKLAQVLARYTQ